MFQHIYIYIYIYPRDAPRDIFLTAAEWLPRLIFGISILSILFIFVHLVNICLSDSYVSLYTPLYVSYLVLALAFLCTHDLLHNLSDSSGSLQSTTVLTIRKTTRLLIYLSISIFIYYIYP